MAKVYTRFQTKTTQKPYPVGRHIPIWLIQGSSHPPSPPGLHSLSSLTEGTSAIVVYHLHWQTCRSMVLANGTQNSGLENFVPESCLPFEQISSIYRKTTAVSKMALKKWNTNFRLEHSVRKNRTTFSNVPLVTEIFR